ncbi:MAG: glycine cleavage system protein H [Gammaproteobacteria bacterium]|nr:MAG: glycine cleavage system protein H [Gammaproteobacteria bacterium]
MAEYRGCELPEDLYYDLDYVWVRPRGDGTYVVGVTDPAQTMAGRVQYVTFKKPGTHRKAGKPVARLESGKWAGGIPAPFDGTIVEVNEKVAKDPGLINIAPYTDAWLVVMRPDDPEHALDRLKTGPEAIEALKAWIDRYDVQCMRCAE